MYFYFFTNITRVTYDNRTATEQGVYIKRTHTNTRARDLLLFNNEHLPQTTGRKPSMCATAASFRRPATGGGCSVRTAGWRLLPSGSCASAPPFYLANSTEDVVMATASSSQTASRICFFFHSHEHRCDHRLQHQCSTREIHQ